jgi:hypothetical protein
MKWSRRGVQGAGLHPSSSRPADFSVDVSTSPQAPLIFGLEPAGGANPPLRWSINSLHQKLLPGAWASAAGDFFRTPRDVAVASVAYRRIGH